jgi:hypothetical protein
VDTTTIDNFSAFIHKMMVAAYPEWETFITFCPDHPNSILLQVPSPHTPELRLEVCTDNEEITVAFASFHTHFGWSDVPDSEAFDRARSFMEDILHERVLIVEYWDSGRVYESSTIAPEQADEYLSLGSEVRVYGWSKQYK